MAGDETLEKRAAQLEGVCLTKPIRQQVLNACLTGTLSEVVRSYNAAELTAEDNEAPNLRGRILVAEDNPLNQALVTETLKHTGCEITMVGDGLKALSALEEQQFDLILMDCQMPQMDGYAATRTIRKQEADAGGQHHIPIVALTANAMRGDREECKAAGMDDYLSKPFSAADLHHKVRCWLGRAVSETSSTLDSGATVATNPGEDVPLLDPAAIENIRAAAPEGAGDDLLIQIIDIYLDESPKLVEQIRSGFKADAPDKVRLAVHSLKSNSANVGAKALASVCKQLEEKARANDLGETETLVADIEVMIEDVFEQLHEQRQRAAA
jgi:CheY-like chemotaxis protein